MWQICRDFRIIQSIPSPKAGSFSVDMADNTRLFNDFR